MYRIRCVAIHIQFRVDADLLSLNLASLFQSAAGRQILTRLGRVVHLDVFDWQSAEMVINLTSQYSILRRRTLSEAGIAIGPIVQDNV